jgi:FMN phosphatase YigB (HAD superfamily)
MKIFIDFDDVLFNAKKFKNDLISIFQKQGVDKEKFEKSYYTYPRKNSDAGRFYYPKDQIKRLKKDYKLDTRKLEKEIKLLMKNLENYIFRDVYSFLMNFKKRDLILITYGHEKFQKEKIKGTKIGKYFRDVVVSRKNKLYEILELIGKNSHDLKEKIVMIDDKAECIEKIEKEMKKIKTIHIRRPQGRYSHLPCEHADYETKNLGQAYKIISLLEN